MQIKKIPSIKISKKKQNKKCFTLKEWSFCLSLVMLTVTAVFCICAAMGKMHTDQVYELLNADIEEERENNFFLDGQLTHNEERLNASKELAIASAWILLVCLFIGTGNLLTVILLIYGIVMDSSLHMILWILSSSITYFISIIALLVLYLKPFHELYILYGTLEITVIISTLFIPVWLVITMHYYNLRKTNNKTKNLYTTTIKGDGGYLHSLNALDEIQKILVI